MNKLIKHNAYEPSPWSMKRNRHEAMPEKWRLQKRWMQMWQRWHFHSWEINFSNMFKATDSNSASHAHITTSQHKTPLNHKLHTYVLLVCWASNHWLESNCISCKTMCWGKKCFTVNKMAEESLKPSSWHRVQSLHLSTTGCFLGFLGKTVHIELPRTCRCLMVCYSLMLLLVITIADLIAYPSSSRLSVTAVHQQVP